MKQKAESLWFELYGKVIFQKHNKLFCFSTEVYFFFFSLESSKSINQGF